MRRQTNCWHDAILAALRSTGEAQRVAEIWQRMEAAGFQHGSQKPRSTLGARVAELVQMKKLERVGPKTYRLVGNDTCPKEAAS